MSVLVSQPPPSPDVNGAGLLAEALDPLRYDGQADDPHEVAGLLKALMPERVRVLDIGCGTGSVTVVANKGKHNNVIAVEPDGRRAAIARERGLEVVCGHLTPEFVDERGPFDVVMLSDVLEHVAAPEDFLGLVLTALKPGGQLLISVPNVAHWSIRLNLLFGRFDYEAHGICDVTHLRWFTEKSATELIRRMGLDVLAVKHTAGKTLAVYREGPLHAIPGAILFRAVQRLTKLFPRLFGCQVVIAARKPAAGSA